MLRNKKGKTIIIIFFSLLLIASILACSPGYIMRAAYEQSKILINREDIKEVISRDSTDPKEKEKLQLVLEARAFAKQIGLDPGESFTQYTKVDKDVLAWILLGSRPDSFTLYTWWFPIVGSVPYKGFFEKEDAQEAAKKLQEKGYETWVRGTDAFSTLGWFNDPVLSTILKQDEVAIVNTVNHESVHSTVWIKGHVDFNESLANFIGMQAAIEFFRIKIESCEQNDSQCRSTLQRFFDASIIVRQRDFELASIINKLYEQLNVLYRSSKTKEQKISERNAVFEEQIKPLREKYPTMKILKTPNNAEIMQLKLYMSDLLLFERLYIKSDYNFRTMIEKIKALEKDLAKSDKPFKVLEDSLN